MPYFGLESENMPLAVLDLNADLGEIENDYEGLISIISSANVACGGHAGGGELLKKTVAAAIQNGVAVGAHPSYPDRDHFGRVSMRGLLTPEELLGQLVEQVQLVIAELDSNGENLHHIKAHGALYNDAMVDQDIAQTLVELARVFQVPLLGLPNSVLEKLSSDSQVEFISEGFVDRAYTQQGTLVPRDQAGAVLTHEQSLEQVREIATNGSLTTIAGGVIPLEIKTLCVHADTPGAAKTAKAVRELLEGLDLVIRSFDN